MSNENSVSQRLLPEELSLPDGRSFSPSSNPIWKVLNPHFRDKKAEAQRLSLQSGSLFQIYD